MTKLQFFYGICVVKGGKKEQTLLFISNYWFLGVEEFEKCRLTDLLYNADDQEFSEGCEGCSPLTTVYIVMRQRV